MFAPARMQKKVEGPRLSGFYKDILNGLKAADKHLPSKYFYDETGDRIFQQIMASPEYYLTRCEMEIFQHQSGQMAAWFAEQKTPFDLVELGPGDATKSYHLLRELLKEKTPFTYYPIDISANVIGWLEERLPDSLPGLHMHPLNGEYLEKMESVGALSARRKIVLFMGANIGNMSPQQAAGFCRELHDRMQPGDLLLIGFDLKKHPKTILDAYNDRLGVTKAFNLNLLQRINREMGANFNTEHFEHYPVYDPGTGACKSFLISRLGQQVSIGHGEQVDFSENEHIFMEVSQKYTIPETEHIAALSGFRPIHTFSDSKNWFVDLLWERMASTP